MRRTRRRDGEGLPRHRQVVQAASAHAFLGAKAAHKHRYEFRAQGHAADAEVHPALINTKGGQPQTLNGLARQRTHVFGQPALGTEASGIERTEQALARDNASLHVLRLGGQHRIGRLDAKLRGHFGQASLCRQLLAIE